MFETRSAPKRVRIYLDPDNYPVGPPFVKILCGPSTTCSKSCEETHILCEDVLASKWSGELKSDLFEWTDMLFKSFL